MITFRRQDYVITTVRINIDGKGFHRNITYSQSRGIEDNITFEVLNENMITNGRRYIQFNSIKYELLLSSRKSRNSDNPFLFL